MNENDPSCNYKFPLERLTLCDPLEGIPGYHLLVFQDGRGSTLTIQVRTEALKDLAERIVRSAPLLNEL